MGEKTTIEWTHHTFNPWWGCEKVSPACTSCYAETFSKRIGQKVWGKDAPRRFFNEKHWIEPHHWDIEAKRLRTRRRVFCASMADVFEERKDLDVHRSKLWDLIETTSALDWLLLTKRPENIKRMVPTSWLRSPRPNVWYGTTVENQEWAEKRIPHLLGVPAAIRFLSVEPMLGPIVLGPCMQTPEAFHRRGIDWIICGGESGHHARPMHPIWAQSLRNQAFTADIRFFFKQWGEWVPRIGLSMDVVKGFHGMKKDLGQDANHPLLMLRLGKAKAGRLLDGQLWNEVPVPKIQNPEITEVTT